MTHKAKSATVHSGARTRAAKAPGNRVRRAATAPDFWEQSAQVPDERDDETDCQRIVQGDGSRSLPLYYDDYN